MRGTEQNTGDLRSVIAGAVTAGELPGTRVGPYKILQLIGEGGFGTVYMAEQEQPVRRRVALKIIKLGMDTKQVVARFEAERQALAMMDHPNIAKVLDAGATDAGRPYFVMELVRGVPITKYCDVNKLSTRERLELFIPICLAVQHAHQKGVIHRDLKPGNVMVTLHDGVPIPKVIDFGIAKATDHSLTARTLFTEYHQLIGTPEYMSPEQAEMSGLDIDTRTDIYSLGVMLYQLLTGTLPFNTRALRGGGPEAIQKYIREVEPPKPSTRVGTGGFDHDDGSGRATSATAAEIARARHTDPASLRRQLRGDLDWIALKAMEKDRTRRYATANGLSMDIRRYLDNEPIAARPPSALYRASKFVRKHKAAAGAAALVSLALVAGIAGTSWGLIDARRQRDEAVSARRNLDQALAQTQNQRDQAKAARDAEAASKQKAEQAAARAQSVTEFMTDMLGLANADITQNPSLTVREVLDRAADQAGRAFRDQPEAEAALRTVIGQAYATQGEPGLALVHLGRALQLRDGAGGGTDEELYKVLVPYYQAVKDSVDNASWVPHFSRSVGAGQRVLGRAHPELAGAWAEAWASANVIPLDESVLTARIREAVRQSSAVLPKDDAAWVLVADQCCAAGICAANLSSRWDVAVAPLREGVELYRRVLPETNTRVVRCMDELYGYLSLAHRFDETETVARRSLELAARTLPDSHWYVAMCRARLGASLLKQGRDAEAQPLLVSAIKVLNGAGGGRAGQVGLQAMIEMLRLSERSGRAEETARYRERVVEAAGSAPGLLSADELAVILGPGESELSAAVAGLSDELFEARTDAGPAYDAMVERRRSSFADNDPRASCIVGALLGPAQRYANSQANVAAALHLYSDMAAVGRACGRMHPERRQIAQWWCALINLMTEHHAEAERLAREGLAAAQGALGEGHWKVASLKYVLGGALVGQHRDAEGERVMLEGYRGLLEALGPQNGNTNGVFMDLVDFYNSRDRAAEGARLSVEHLRRLVVANGTAPSLNRAAWYVVRIPGLTPEDYGAAVEGAARASAARRNEPMYSNTLGVGQYRVGKYAEALRTLEQSERLCAGGAAGSQSSNWVFMAMAHARLGNAAEASRALARGKETLKNPGQAESPENQWFVREAEAVVAGN